MDLFVQATCDIVHDQTCLSPKQCCKKKIFRFSCARLTLEDHIHRSRLWLALGTDLTIVYFSFSSSLTSLSLTTMATLKVVEDWEWWSGSGGGAHDLQLVMTNCQKILLKARDLCLSPVPSLRSNAYKKVFTYNLQGWRCLVDHNSWEAEGPGRHSSTCMRASYWVASPYGLAVQGWSCWALVARIAHGHIVWMLLLFSYGA